MTGQARQCQGYSMKVTDVEPGGTSASKTRLAPKARELLTERTNGLPVWIRAPKTGTDYFSGFSRSKLYELAGVGAIRSVSISEPGQVKDTRLFNLASILAFIEKCEQKHRRKESWLRLQPYVQFSLRTMDFIFWLIRNWSG
jgi:hypothetical protein